MPARPAIAARCTMPLVDPLIACSTAEALRSAARFRISLGRGPPALAISTARVPVASAMRMRSADTAGAVAAPGSVKPSVSASDAMVEAVPITMQVPEVGIRLSCARSRFASSRVPARKAAHSRRQSVQAPSRAPSWRPASIGPTGSTIAGTSALTAPISSAGIVLSQPPISTTASTGSARSISSVSIDMRLRSSIEVGNENASWIEMVGKTNGRPPASRTPAAVFSASRAAVPWQGLKSDAVERMPTIGRSSASSV